MCEAKSCAPLEPDRITAQFAAVFVQQENGATRQLARRVADAAARTRTATRHDPPTKRRANQKFYSSLAGGSVEPQRYWSLAPSPIHLPSSARSVAVIAVRLRKGMVLL